MLKQTLLVGAAGVAGVPMVMTALDNPAIAQYIPAPVEQVVNNAAGMLPGGDTASEPVVNYAPMDSDCIDQQTRTFTLLAKTCGGKHGELK